MAHHGSEPFMDDMDETKRRELVEMAHKNRGEFAKRLFNLDTGATGNFPDGKLKPDDEGEIKIAITNKDSRVIIDFGKSIAWIGFTKEQAKSLAELLLKHSEG
jgi:hypothetical protein